MWGLAIALIMLALPASAGAWTPPPTTDEGRLTAYLPIARAAWPASPCAGREQIHLHADTELRAIDGDGHESDGRAQPATCEIWLRSNLDAVAFCSVLTHEGGHLAGYGHTDDPLAALAPGLAQQAAMRPGSHEYQPCLNAIGQRAAANSRATATLAKWRPDWTVYCGQRTCIAWRVGAHTRRYHFENDGTVDFAADILCGHRTCGRVRSTLSA